jgi:leucyl aminopeptidase
MDRRIFAQPTVLDAYAKTRLSSGAEIWLVARPEKRSPPIPKGLPVWQRKLLTQSDKELFRGAGPRGPVLILTLKDWSFGVARDRVGALYREHAKEFAKDFSGVHVEARGLSESALRGALLGLGLASYDYKSFGDGSGLKFSFFSDGKPVASELLAEAQIWARCQNGVRHLVNMPGADLGPARFSELMRSAFRGVKEVAVKVMGPDQVKAQKMGLLYGVGQGSEDGAFCVHLRYRPRGARIQKPLALVGKGVTFDTGGLDLKPASNMRLMKKDMAGAATVAGVFAAAVALKTHQSLDVYLALAENAVSEKSMRPGDILRSRNGLTVEIDNTDAEGRLALADALDLAITQKSPDRPRAVIDVATLTGAMRVALGLDVAGFFTNSEELSNQILNASGEVGEVAWRMPLIEKYFKSYRSPVADMTNSSSDSFGGAITAALFLQKFVGDVPWLHFDVMAWNRSSDGPYTEGGNGQCFQILTQLISEAR